MHCHPEPSSGPSSSRGSAATRVANRGTMIVALAGQPNVGKSTIFNMLTGLSQHVGNWPGKTVEQKTGTYAAGGVEFRVVDLPGTYSLTAASEEERITRDFIIQERPDVVVAVVDAAIPERSLYLLAELLLLPAPVVLVMNMMDVAQQEGIEIEPPVLEAALGIPVVPMVATRSEGTAKMVEAVTSIANETYPYAPRRPTILPAHQEVLARLITLIAPYIQDPYPIDWVALKLLEGDDEIHAMVEATVPPDVSEAVHGVLHQHEDAVLDVAGARYEWIGRMVRAAVARPRVGQVGLTSRVDAVLTHPLWGTLALLGVLGLVFGLTFAVGNPLQVWLDELLTRLAEVLAEGLLAASAPHWLSDLLSNGLLGGVGMVATFLPILAIFYFVLGVLEDTGYMARAAFITDRFMHMMGLHGKSFMPLLLGFGCNVPAVFGARIVESERARILTLLLAPLVPCAAQLTVVMILGTTLFGNAAAFIVWGLVALNLIVLAGLGLFLNRIVLKGERAVFIMELPLYHLPNARTIGLYVWQNLVAFLQKAGSVILIASLVVWFLSYLPNGGDITHSFLAILGRALEPLGRLMGFPWQILVALLTSIVAKENTIATLGVLYGNIVAVLPTVLSMPAALSLLVVQTLFVPCVATLAAMKQESGTWRWAIAGFGFLLVFSIGAGVLVYQVGTLLTGG